MTEHHCHPGWKLTPTRTLIPVHADIGDTWECDCGKRYIAHDSPTNHATIGQRTHNHVQWKPIHPPNTPWWKRWRTP